MVSKDERKAIEAAKQASTGQLLMKAARLFNERALALVRERSWREIRPAHTSLFPHIDLEGTRITEIARRVGISKQAVGQLVDELEEMGAVERVPDPEDGRAKLVRFAQTNGRSVIFDGLEMLRELESDLAEKIGPRRMTALRGVLIDLVEELE